MQIYIFNFIFLKTNNIIVERSSDFHFSHKLQKKAWYANDKRNRTFGKQ